MPQRSCEWQNCEKPAVQLLGDCSMYPEDKWEYYSTKSAAAEARLPDNLCHRIDSMKLCARVSMLSGGVTCTVDLSRHNLSAMMGGQNCHAGITFEDGIRWLARFRLASTSSPLQDVRDWALRSEAVTMTFLQQHTSIPAPQIFDWACESDPQNMLGVDYILMEKLNGKALDWQAATDQQKKKIMQQLADIYLEIEKYPFDKMVSLAFSTDGTIGVQALALPSTYRLDSGPLGPFTSCREGTQALLGSYLAMIASGEIDSYSPVDSYLVHKHRQELSSSLFPDNAEENKFYFKHPDDKGDHILVNDHFNIVGIIDWEMDPYSLQSRSI